MGLYREWPLQSGITVSHWAISDFAANRETHKFSIFVVPYISKAIRDSGGAPIKAEQITVYVEDLKYPPGHEWRDSLHYTEYFSPEALEGRDIYAVMYNYLKSNIEFFKEAKDE